MALASVQAMHGRTINSACVLAWDKVSDSPSRTDAYFPHRPELIDTYSIATPGAETSGSNWVRDDFNDEAHRSLGTVCQSVGNEDDIRVRLFFRTCFQYRLVENPLPNGPRLITRLYTEAHGTFQDGWMFGPSEWFGYPDQRNILDQTSDSVMYDEIRAVHETRAVRERFEDALSDAAAQSGGDAVSWRDFFAELSRRAPEQSNVKFTAAEIAELSATSYVSALHGSAKESMVSRSAMSWSDVIPRCNEAVKFMF